MTAELNRHGPTPILLVSPSGVIGGAERAFVGLARTLPAKGFQLTAALLQPGPLKGMLTEAGCETHTLSAHRTRQVIRTARTVHVLRRLVASTRAHAVVSNMSKGHFFGGLAARAAGVPAVFWQHGIPVASLLEWVAGMVPARAIVCPSQVAVNAQRALTPGRRVCKINPGIPVAEITSSQGRGKAIRHSLGWERHPIVGIVGRLQAGKGQEVFLQAAARLTDTRPEARFVVVGDAILGWEGSYPDDLRRLAAELGLDARVHFAGHQTDVYPWYDALDVVVHASFGESFGLVPVEAMALGRPLVATAAGGPLEIVEDSVSGLLVPPGDPERLAEAIDRILADSSLASALGRGAVERAKAFSEDGMAVRFAELLRSLITDGDRLSRRLVPGEGS